VIEWLESQHDWSVERLCDYIETIYGVVFQSRQSYCQLLADADIAYKQAQRINPKKLPGKDDSPSALWVRAPGDFVSRAPDCSLCSCHYFGGCLGGRFALCVDNASR
jgi:hypothetical protein